MQTIFIVIWVLTAIAVTVFSVRVGIRVQTKKLGYPFEIPSLYRLDDLFLGIGATFLVQTFIVGTIVYGWVEEMNAAIARNDLGWILENDHRIVAAWYSTSATYIFSIVSSPRNALMQWFIKLGIAWFLSRLSNNIPRYGRFKNLLFWFVLGSFVCVIIIFWSVCPPNDFVEETVSSFPPSTSFIKSLT